MMRVLLAMVAVVLLGAAESPGVLSSGSMKFVLIVNRANPVREMTVREIQSVFTGRRETWNGVLPVVRFTRPAVSQVANVFYTQILGMDVNRFEYLWSTREISRRGSAPEAIDDVAELIDRIAAVEGAIGFATVSELPADTTRVHLLDVQASPSGAAPAPSH